MVGGASLAPCYFPTSSTRRDGGRIHTIEVPQERIPKISWWRKDLGPRLRVIWAIALHLFIYHDTVVMGYEEHVATDDSYMMQNCSTCYSIAIDLADDLQSLTRQKHIAEDGAGPRLYNSGVLLLDNETPGMTGGLTNGIAQGDPRMVSVSEISMFRAALNESNRYTV